VQTEKPKSRQKNKNNSKIKITGKYVVYNLISGKSIVYEGKNHWINYLSLRMLLLLPVFENMTDEYTVTNKRLVIIIGIISRRTLEMNLSKIETVKVNRGIFGRMLNYGDITVIGSGRTREPFKKIGDPMEFKKKFNEQVHA